MKKLISFLLLIFIGLSFAACTGGFSTTLFTTTDVATNDFMTDNETTVDSTTVGVTDTFPTTTITDPVTTAFTTIPITTTTWTTEDVTTTEPVDFINVLLASLTLREKASQMVQAERGSISNEQVTQYGIGSILSGGGSHPTAYDDSVDTWYNMYSNYQTAALNSSSGIPIIYGIDAVHGNNNLYGATIFPHNIGLGMTNNPELIYNISKATAEEMLVTGINWPSHRLLAWFKISAGEEPMKDLVKTLKSMSI
jgi:hypothetical protein